MNIVVRISPPQSAQFGVKQRFGDLFLSETIDLFDLDFGSKRFREYLDLTKHEKEGTWFNPWMEFEEKELDACNFLHPVCRGPVFSESDADHRQTRKWLDDSAEIDTVKGTKIKLLSRMCVRNRKLKPNTIAGALEWTSDFILPTSVVNIFKNAKLKGFEAKEVINRKAKRPFEDFHLLYGAHLMPPAIKVVHPPENRPFAERMGGSMEKLGFSRDEADAIGAVVDSEDTTYRLLGCLCYENLNKAEISDFNRTAEPWGSHDFPLWVVSKRVRQVFRGNKLKGWIFEPVLEKGSDLFEIHQDQWRQFLGSIQVNRANRL